MSVAGATGQRSRLLSGRVRVRLSGDARRVGVTVISPGPQPGECRFKSGTRHPGPIVYWLGFGPFKAAKTGRNRLGLPRHGTCATNLAWPNGGAVATRVQVAPVPLMLYLLITSGKACAYPGRSATFFRRRNTASERRSPSHGRTASMSRESVHVAPRPIVVMAYDETFTGVARGPVRRP